MKQATVDNLKLAWRIFSFLFVVGAVFLVAAAAVQIVLPKAREVHLLFPLICVVMLLADKLRVRE